MHNYLKSFLNDESGSLTPIFASAIFPILFLSGAAIDYTTQSKNKALISQVADAALLGVANETREIVETVTDEAQLKTEVKALLDPMLTSSLSNFTNVTYEIDSVVYDDTTSQLKIDINMSQDTTFLGLAKIDTLDAKISTAVTLDAPTKNALSVAFVLDKSGSMGWYQRWPTLLQAMDSLEQKFKDTDPERKYIRTGLTMFDHSGYPFYGMKWNMKKITNKLKTYWPGGGTNSSYSMYYAYNYLNSNFEDNKHEKRNDSELRKVILFMTDGSNNYVSSDNYTLASCNAAKNAGIEIFTISFGAQGRAKTMLENCSSGPEFFIPANNNAQLLEAFDAIGETISSEYYLSE